MKKIILSLIIIVGLFTITGCGNNNVNVEKGNDLSNNEEKNNNNADREIGCFGNYDYEGERCYHLDKYDSEIFYTKDLTIKYKMFDGYDSEYKQVGRQGSMESFVKYNTDYYSINIALYLTNYHGINKDKSKQGAETYLIDKKKFEEDYDSRNQVTDIKSINIGNYKVYYIIEKDFIVSEKTIIYLAFNINDDMFFTLNATTKIKYEDLKDTNLDMFKSIIESVSIN